MRPHGEIRAFEGPWYRDHIGDISRDCADRGRVLWEPQAARGTFRSGAIGLVKYQYLELTASVTRLALTPKLGEHVCCEKTRGATAYDEHGNLDGVLDML